MAQPDKARAWTFTQKGHDEAVIAQLKELECERMAVGREVGEGGYLHLQGYVRFANPVRRSALKKILPIAHWEVQGWKHGKKINATETSACNYCVKDCDVVIDRGLNKDECFNQGTLSKDAETDMIIEEIEKGAKYGQIRQRHKRFCFWHRQNVLSYIKDEEVFGSIKEPPTTE